MSNHHHQIPIFNPASASDQASPSCRLMDLGISYPAKRMDDYEALAYLDSNGDGTKHVTGWVATGEAIVVRDINGNGLIDSGRELFGDATVLTRGPKAGQNAANGFAALAAFDLDTNGVSDGRFDANDTAYSTVKLWRGTNQDGISQANELQHLDDLNITSANTNGKATASQTGQVINNNNGVALSTTFTQNRQTKTVGAIVLEANNIVTQFSTEVVDNTGVPFAIMAQAQGLTQTNETGMVRKIWPAASLDGAFASALSDFAAATTRIAQLSAIERFNDQPFIERYIPTTNSSYYDPATGAYKGYTPFTISIEPQRLRALKSVYDSLKASTYKSLYLQTKGSQLLSSQQNQNSKYYQFSSCLRKNELIKTPIRYCKTSCNSRGAYLRRRIFSSNLVATCTPS